MNFGFTSLQGVWLCSAYLLWVGYGKQTSATQSYN
jgi:hypothetical protein